MSVINRTLNEQNVERTRNHLGSLLKRVRESRGELLLAVRENYLNLYHRGNAAARISFSRGGKFTVSVNKKFIHADNPMLGSAGFQERGSEIQFKVPEREARSFFAKSNLKMIMRKIKEVAYSDELALEQALVTDNQDSADWVLIDRQVEDHSDINGAIDVLALRHMGEARFRFVILELKLGNNPELRGKVIGQLDRYHERLTTYFDDYRACYEEQYRQKFALGLIANCHEPSIEIDDEVEGAVVIGGYSGLAKVAEEELRALGGNWPIVRLDYALPADLSKYS